MLVILTFCKNKFLFPHHVDSELGMATTIAIAIHELPHEIGDFAVLIKKNYKLKGILLT